MRYSILIFLFALYSCNFESNAEANQKRKEKIFFTLFVLDSIAKNQRTGGVISISCSEDPTGMFTNLKSIDIYFNNSFFFNNPLNSGFIELGICEKKGKYWISLKDNSKLKTLTVYYKVNQNNYEYTGARLDFKDDTFKEYSMNFNGNPNTFTEFTVGEYRFVAVR